MDHLTIRTAIFVYSPERRVPTQHPLRTIRELREAFRDLDHDFRILYSTTGRPSIPPEQLLSVLLLQVFYGVRSERQLIEQLDYNLHLSVDGTLIEAWAGHKSFKPKSDTDGNGANFHGTTRKNNTHESTTDPDSRLYRKSEGKESKLCYMGHATMENGNGLAVAALVTQASGTAERAAAGEDAGEERLATYPHHGRRGQGL